MMSTRIWMFLWSVLTSSYAYADLIIETSYRQGNHKRVDRILIGDHLVRVEVLDGSKLYTLFDSKSKTLWSVNTEDKTYTEVSERSLAEVQMKLKGYQKSMMQRPEFKAQIKQMTPEQRKKMMRMFGPKEEKNPVTSKWSIRKTGKKMRIKSWNCKIYDFYKDGEKTNSTCLARYKELRMQGKELKPLIAMWKFFSESMGQMSQLGDAKSRGKIFQMVEKEGYMVWSQTSEVPPSETRLRKVSRKKLRPEIFRVPQGFKKQENPVITGPLEGSYTRPPSKGKER